MKTKKYIYSLVAVFLSAFLMSLVHKNNDVNLKKESINYYNGFTLLSSHLKNGNYQVYSVGSLIVSNASMLRSVLPQALYHTNPRRWSGNNAPSFNYAGHFGGSELHVPSTTYAKMGILSNPTHLGGMFRINKSGAQHMGFKIVLSVNESNWSNGPVHQKYDMKYVLTHELVHGVGLNHNSLDGKLMSQYSQTGIRHNITNDEINGFNHIYNGGGTGNVNFYCKEILQGSSKYLFWRLEGLNLSNQFVLGFNIYKKSENGDLINVNEKLIPTSHEVKDYEFVINRDINNDYYIEIVKDDRSNNRFIKFDSNR